jgi:CheY-like chemotaxis protein
LKPPNRILIIDDDVTIRHLLSVVLSPLGFHLQSVGNAEEGLRIIETERPDVVITDMRLPGMSGRELCERTNPLKQKQSFLTILLSANPLADQSRWIESLQDTVFVVKPFSPSVLRKHVVHFMDKQSMSTLTVV